MESKLEAITEPPGEIRSNRRPRRIPKLDGFRGLAILLVVTG